MDMNETANGSRNKSHTVSFQYTHCNLPTLTYVSN